MFIYLVEEKAWNLSLSSLTCFFSGCQLSLIYVFLYVNIYISISCKYTKVVYGVVWCIFYDWENWEWDFSHVPIFSGAPLSLQGLLLFFRRLRHAFASALLSVSRYCRMISPTGRGWFSFCFIIRMFLFCSLTLMPT